MATASARAWLPPSRRGKPVSGDVRLWLVVTAAVVAAVLVWVPWIRPLAYPFRLLVSLVHELSHGLAALVTGGHFRNFVVFGDGSGLAYTAGGWRLVVIPAGYLGATTFGAALIFLGTSLKGSRWALGILGTAMALLSLRYGLPGLFHEHVLGALLAVVSGTALGAIFLWICFKAADRLVVFTIHLVAFLAGINAFSDLWYLIGLSTSQAASATDARSMADITWFPAVFWAILWALCSAVILILAVRAAWNRGTL